MAIQMELTRVLIMENEATHIVELKEVGGERALPIVIGINEAAAIERRVLGQAPPRPLTHELLASVIEALGATVERVLISEFNRDMQDGIFFARLFLRQGNKTIEIDSRPSDAIALGATTNVPIFVEEQVLEEVWRPD